MGRFCARRYVAIETAISAAINTVLSVAPAALSFAGWGTVPIASAHGVAFDAAPQLFMSALMSALVPALLTHRRQLKGTVRTSPTGGRMSLIRIACVSLLFAAPLTAFGMFMVGILLPRMVGTYPKAGAMLLLNGAYGGCLAAIVTSSALLVLFGRGWRRGCGHDTHLSSGGGS